MRITIFALFLIACSGTPSASFDDLEVARGTAKENALYNAQEFRQTNIEVQAYAVESRGDSSQTPDCPQGDGWATLLLVSPDHNQKIKLKCSTVSGAVGCLPETEFVTRPYASEDGHCADTGSVPYPLPKIGK